jgi:hypothetical protein
VAYHVFVHPLVVEYLFRPEVIGNQARERLSTSLIDNLSKFGELYRRTNLRVGPAGSPCFWYDYILRDVDGQWKHFWFAVSEARAAVGVLIVGYVECRQ